MPGQKQIRKRSLGANLGATRADDQPIRRTWLNRQRGHVRGDGPIRTWLNSHSGIYGSEGTGDLLSGCGNFQSHLTAAELAVPAIFDASASRLIMADTLSKLCSDDFRRERKKSGRVSASCR
jgi:hypothetical protein